MIAGAREGLKAIEDELVEKEEDRERLELTAPVAGVVLPPPEIPRRPDQRRPTIRRFGAPPWISRNDHAYLAESTLVCMIGDPQAMQANLVVDQSHLDFVGRRARSDHHARSSAARHVPWQDSGHRQRAR